MKLLEKQDYKKLTEPLKKVTINNLFARSVVEHKVTGKIFVDNTDDPKTFYVVHPYGMTLLFGDCNNEAFNSGFRDYSLNIPHVRVTHEWMQAFPGNWDNVPKELFKDRLIKPAENKAKEETGIIELNTRVNFRFNRDKYLNFRKTNLAPEIKIVRTDKQIFRDMKGSVIPFYFWDSEDDFLKNGVGFSLYEPIWACRLENIGSYKLAQKTGFIPSAEIPYYRLSK